MEIPIKDMELMLERYHDSEKQNCLTCEFEPEWSKPYDSGIAKTCVGDCQHPILLREDETGTPYRRGIIWHKNDENNQPDCKTWEPKK